MTRDEWKDHKDFDTLSSEMNGDFSAHRLLMMTTEESFLKPKSLNKGEIIDNGPSAT